VRKHRSLSAQWDRARPLSCVHRHTHTYRHKLSYTRTINPIVRWHRKGIIPGGASVIAMYTNTTHSRAMRESRSTKIVPPLHMVRARGAPTAAELLWRIRIDMLIFCALNFHGWLPSETGCFQMATCFAIYQHVLVHTAALDDLGGQCAVRQGCGDAGGRCGKRQETCGVHAACGRAERSSSRALANQSGTKTSTS
jgi:hypothetical protein